jgi:uncharacterized protein YndB with AHSA1/START domain
LIALTQPHLIEEWRMKNGFKPVVGHRFNFRADCPSGGVSQTKKIARSGNHGAPMAFKPWIKNL